MAIIAPGRRRAGRAAITADWPGSWWIDPILGMGIAAVSAWEAARRRLLLTAPSTWGSW